LELQQNGTLTTHKSENVVLSVMPLKYIKEYKFNVGDLLKFSIKSVNIQETRVNGLTYIKKASLSRILPDIWTKIIFQYQARNNESISFKQLINAATIKANIVPKNENEWNNLSKNAENELLRIATLGIKPQND